MAEEDLKPALLFEPMETRGVVTRLVHQPVRLFRAKVPGGWIVLSHGSTSHTICFVPDPNHAWDGTSTVEDSGGGGEPEPEPVLDPPQPAQ